MHDHSWAGVIGELEFGSVASQILRDLHAPVILAQLGHRPALLADPPMVADDAGRQIPWVTSLRAATCDHPSRRLECCPRTVRSRVANAEN